MLIHIYDDRVNAVPAEPRDAVNYHLNSRVSEQRSHYTLADLPGNKNNTRNPRYRTIDRLSLMNTTGKRHLFKREIEKNKIKN